MAIALAAGIEIVVAARSPVIAKDGMTFIGIAKDLGGDPLAAIRGSDQHPGYPAMILGVRSVLGWLHAGDALGTWMVSARAVAMLFGLLSVVALWLLARRAFDPQSAGIAAVLFAILPVFRENASDAVSDAPHLFFYLLATWMALEGIQRCRFGWFPAAGASAGVAFWIRPEGLLPAAVGAAVILALVALRRVRSVPALTWLVGLTIAAGLVIAPYVGIKGQLTSKKRFSVLVRDAEAGQDIPQSLPVASFPPPGVSEPKGRGGLRAPGEGALTLMNVYAHSLRYFLLLPLAIGLFIPGAPKAEASSRIFLGVLALANIVLLLMLHAVAGYIAGRHTMPLVFMSLLWSAGGISWLSGRLSAQVPPGLTATGGLNPRRIACILVAVVVLSLLPRSVRSLHSHNLPMVQAARWIRARAASGDAVLTNSPYVPFYSELPGSVLKANEREIPDIASGPGGRPHRFIVLERSSPNFHLFPLPELLETYERVSVPGFPKEDAPLVLVLRSASAR